MGSILSCFLPFGKAGELQIPCSKGFAVDYYGFTLCALALKPSDFCNIGGKSKDLEKNKMDKDCTGFSSKFKASPLTHNLRIHRPRQ